MTDKYKWDLNKPLSLKIQYCKSAIKELKSDRTLLNFEFDEGAFSVSVDDVLENGCVYVKDFGLFVVPGLSNLTVDDYKQQITDKKTILERVKQSPDQSFKQAMDKVHRAIQDNGPTMLSLAGDNQKFVLEQNGNITYRKDDIAPVLKAENELCKLMPQFGSAKVEKLARKLHGDWLPIVVNTLQEGGVTYSQTSFVAPMGPVNNDVHPWLSRKGLCCAQFAIENPQTNKSDVSLKLQFATNIKDKQPAEIKQAKNGFVLVQSGDQLLALVDANNLTALKFDLGKSELNISGQIQGQMTERLGVYIPGWEMKADQWMQLAQRGNVLADTEAYWNKIIGSVSTIDIPEPLLSNVIRASQVHCLISTRNEEQGKRFVPWIASVHYGPLESESHSVVHGMGLLGYDDFAQRSLDFFINKYNDKGYLTTGYTVMGHGWHLWTLAKYYQRTKDKVWFKRVAPEVARASEWIARQREKTKRMDVKGEKMPEYGLMPPGVAADWNRFGYRSYLQGNFYAGLNETAQALADIDYPSAKELSANAADFRSEIQRAYSWTQAHSPVLPLDDGTWVPYYPAFIYCFGTSEFMFPKEDGNRSWIYDVELGSHHFGVLSVLDATDRNIEWMINRMEDIWFFHDGMGEYPANETTKDWFNLGFSKVQPYYTRIQELYAVRDDVKPFIRAYFNALPTLLNTENLSFWEHFHNLGAWNKTHETGWFLVQTRTMMLSERGDELWLAPFVTNHWTKPGMTVGMKDAPTNFGPVTYKITSATDKGYIEAVIEPPTRKAPKAIVIRLRHPDQKHIKAVTVNGKSHTDFNAEKEYVRLTDLSGPITIKAEY